MTVTGLLLYSSILLWLLSAIALLLIYKDTTNRCAQVTGKDSYIEPSKLFILLLIAFIPFINTMFLCLVNYVRRRTSNNANLMQLIFLSPYAIIEQGNKFVDSD